MIVILYEASDKIVAEEVVATLHDAFRSNVDIRLMEAEDAREWPAEMSWDDLLIIVFSRTNFSAAGNAFIDDFIARRGDGALILPVALDMAARQPPTPAAQIKALPFDTANEGRSRLVSRAGGMLGLRLQGRQSKIFISYRATDGSTIANQLRAHLSSLGYNPFLDEAVELDGHTTILPGSPVQAQIDKALGEASLVLLLDTPSAPKSIWIRHEVDTADAMLVPILPVCFREAVDPLKGPRFRSLVALQRWIPLPLPTSDEIAPLSVAQLDQIVKDVEAYSCEIFRRKCRIPFIVEREFMSNGFDWSIRDKPRLMFESTKSAGRIKTRIISHCSIFDQIYGPALNQFRRFLGDSGSPNYSLFIYDGNLLSDIELGDVAETHGDDIIVLHHQELSSLISSNFTNLGSS
jgi:hypothetical protein